MIDKINKLLKEQNMNIRQLAKACNISPSVFYSMSNRKKVNPDKPVVINTDILEKVCKVLNVSPNYFFDIPSETTSLSPEETKVITKYRTLDDFGKQAVEAILDIEHSRIHTKEEPTKKDSKDKIIPFFVTPAAAGYASPAFGSDYTDLAVPADSPADFAVKIDGDSMEPYIKDGSTVLVKRTTYINDGDVGIFYVDGDMKCKQFCKDILGNIYLFSLNRKRSDADSQIMASSQSTIICYGKVLLPKRIPLP